MSQHAALPKDYRYLSSASILNSMSGMKGCALKVRCTESQPVDLDRMGVAELANSLIAEEGGSMVLAMPLWLQPRSEFPYFLITMIV